MNAVRESFVNQQMQEMIDELQGVTGGEAAPSRDVIYGDAVNDFDVVSDEFQRKEMRGHFCILAHYCNLFAKAVEGKAFFDTFYDEDGNM